MYDVILYNKKSKAYEYLSQEYELRNRWGNSRLEQEVKLGAEGWGADGGGRVMSLTDKAGRSLLEVILRLNCEGVETMSKAKGKKIMKRQSRGKEKPVCIQEKSRQIQKELMASKQSPRNSCYSRSWAVLQITSFHPSSKLHNGQPGSMTRPESLGESGFILFSNIHYTPFLTTKKLE